MTGHAWPLTLTDAKTRGRKNELHKYKYALDKVVQGAPIRSRGVLPKASSTGARGQLRLSLTNTYHEWPDKPTNWTSPVRVPLLDCTAKDIADLKVVLEAYADMVAAPAQ